MYRKRVHVCGLGRDSCVDISAVWLCCVCTDFLCGVLSYESLGICLMSNSVILSRCFVLGLFVFLFFFFASLLLHVGLTLGRLFPTRLHSASNPI
jgi:hypothetical protein